jgi:hypothetical protein
VSEKQHEDLTPEELEEEKGELLPDREEMTVLPLGPGHGGGVTLPIEPPATE